MNRRKNENQTRRHRLIGHDYSDPGYYFVTFGTKDGRHLLGDIEEGRMALSPTGLALVENIKSLPIELEQMGIDSFAVMPNHVHLLIYLYIDKEPISISDIVRLIKGRSAAIHRKITNDPNGLWHKGFHDEILRNDKHLETVRQYIADNPLRWENKDRY